MTRIYVELKKMLSGADREVHSHFPIYVLLATILLAAFFIRVYRQNDLLGFYYDQGRDALVIWKLWNEGKPFLIGPITGLKGIFLGPFYYYLIAPLYLIGGGDPVYPAVFLAFLSTLALLVIYCLGWKMHSRAAGIIAATIGGFSYYIVTTSRWLSNPNPILLSSSLFLLSLWKIVSGGSKYWWVIASLLVGISLHFESASAVFYIPIMVVFAIWILLRERLGGQETRNFPGIKIILFSLIAFLGTLLPQIIFNFRHDNLLLKNFTGLFFQEKAFRSVSRIEFWDKMDFFWEVFDAKILLGWSTYTAVFTLVGLAALGSSKTRDKRILPLFGIFLITPMFFYIFFQGNFGNFYDYYLSGYYLPMILFFALGMGELWKYGLSKFVIIFYFIIFFNVNGTPLVNMMRDPRTGPTDIKFTSQIASVYWVYDNAMARGNFNVDVYVPPVIPHAYDYLFLWEGTLRYTQGKPGCEEDLCGKVDEQVPLLYTLYEQDPPNPERLEAWLARQEGVGVVEESTRFGGITVERRRRF